MHHAHQRTLHPERLVRHMHGHRHFLLAKVSNHRTSKWQEDVLQADQRFQFSFHRPFLHQAIVLLALFPEVQEIELDLLLQRVEALYQ